MLIEGEDLGNSLSLRDPDQGSIGEVHRQIAVFVNEFANSPSILCGEVCKVEVARLDLLQKSILPLSGLIE